MPAFPQRDSMKSKAAWPSASTNRALDASGWKEVSCGRVFERTCLAKEDEVAGIPGVPLVFGQAFGDPGWRGAARQDVESEDVGDFVGEEPEPLIGRNVDPEQDAISTIAGGKGDIRRAR